MAWIETEEYVQLKEILNLFKKTYKKYYSQFNHAKLNNAFEFFIFRLIFGISFFTFSPTFDAKLGIIDDHEIVYFSTKDHPLKFREIIPT
jgi:hypothetical protein